MIQEFVKAWDARKCEVRAKIRAKHPESYEELVRWVVEILGEDDSFDKPDPNRIYQIGGGDYHGTLLFAIAAEDYEPRNYWYVKVAYGSCSGCDTLLAIRNYDGDIPNDSQVNDYMTLALHILQGLKKMSEDAV